MNKIKRLYLLVMHMNLRIIRFISNSLYKKYSYRYFRKCGIDFLGKPKYINYDVDFDLLAPNKIHIGENTVIAKQTIILVHDYSIECGLEIIEKSNSQYEVQFLKDVIIGKNCFIGARSFILPGAKIGDNCIVGAGSVVSGKIPENSIVVGNPAKIISNTKEWAERKYKENNFYPGTKNKGRK